MPQLKTRDGKGAWTESKPTQDTEALILVPDRRYVMPDEVYQVLQARQKYPPPFRYPKFPQLADLETEEAKLQYLLDAWTIIRRVKRAWGESTTNLGLDKLRTTIRLFERNSIAPLAWYWWVWTRPEFRGRRKGKALAPFPNLTFALQPARVEGMLPEYKATRDDSWRLPPPKIPSVTEVLSVAHEYREAVMREKPLTKADAIRVLDDVMPKSEYDRKLRLATEDVEAHMRQLARLVDEGGWVWR